MSFDDWIRAQLDPAGMSELVHERPWATVRRVPLAGGVAWFKACAPVQAFEVRLTAVLARRWPDRLPEVLASDEQRAWLLLADAGAPLGFDAGIGAWLSILPRYAELQRGETAYADEHLAAGVPDRRVGVFPALYEAMLARGLPELAPLAGFEPQFAELCDELAAGGIRDTVQHDDLHGANVYVRSGGTRILDWGDACISHPFLTAFVTFLHLAGGGDSRLRDAYLEPWGRPVELRRTFELALRLGAFAHLFKELHVLDAVPAGERARFAPDLPALVRHCVAALA